MLTVKHAAVRLAAFAAWPVCLAAQQNPAAVAFRKAALSIQEKSLLAADAMPADKYGFRATATQLSFSEVAADLVWRTENLCSGISGVPAPEGAMVTSNSGKDTLVSRLRLSDDFCRSALGRLDDSRLADSVFVRIVRENGPVSRRPRAEAMMLALAYWQESYSYLAQSLRLIGKIPPIPCTTSLAEGNCDNSINRCVETQPGVMGRILTLSDAPYTVTSDGRGPYRRFTGNVGVVYLGWPAVVTLAPFRFDANEWRSIRVDLSHPVAGDIGVPLGVISDSAGVEVGAQSGTEPNYMSHVMTEIPIGATVKAAQVDVGFHINGVYHVLQMGPQPWGHCWSDGTTIFGNGTSQGTIHRASEKQWIVDLPPGSIGRLFDNHLSSPNAVNKGRYYVALHFVIERQ
jgi:hypothetical protein